MACASEVEPELPEPPTIENLADLQAALAEAGVTVTQVPNPSAPSLGVEPHGLVVGTAPVHAYEYSSVVQRRLVSETIRAGGYLVSGEPVDWPARPNIWAKGQLIVVYSGVDGGIVLLLGGLLGDPLNFKAPAVDEPYPPAILSAIGAASDSTGISPEEVQVIEYEFREWANGCLGLAEPDELCTEAMVPGWLIRLNAGGELIIFRADEVGSELRRE